MKRPNGFVWSVMLLIAVQPFQEVESNPIGAAIGVVSGIMGIIEFFKARYSEYLKLAEGDKIQSVIQKESSDWEARMNWNFDTIHTAIKDMESRREFSKSMDSLRKSFTLIHNNFKSMLERTRLFKNGSNVDPLLSKFYKSRADKILDEYSYNSPLQVIYDTIGDSFKNYSIYQRPLIGQYEDHLNVCVTHVSPLQTVSKLLEHVVWTSTYYHSTILMSHRILNILEGKNITLDGLSTMYGNEIAGWYNETIASIGHGLRNVSRKIYACGLPDLSKKEQYYKIEWGKTFFLRKCSALVQELTCSSMDEAGICKAENPKAVCSVSRPCARGLHDCKEVNNLDVCVSNSPTGPRYEYYQDSHITASYDSYGVCQVEKLRKESRHQSGNPSGRVIPPPNPYSCGACQCTCQEESFFINEEGAYADVQNDMIVTGAKFVVKDNMLEIHIQQGKFLRNGAIEVPANGTNSLPWIGPKGTQRVPINWEERKVLLSTEIGAIGGQVVTGLRLTYDWIKPRKIGSNERAIRLEVLAAPVVFVEGSLNKKQTLTHEAEKLPERELNLANAESPRGASTILEEITQNNVTFKFTTSGGKDGGQSMIPFIDTREVTSAVPTALSGAALHWKGKEGTGGFLGITLYSYNLVPDITKDHSYSAISEQLENRS